MRRRRTPNKARLRQWVKALRSGKYKQDTGRLGDAKTGYCCLGVACIAAEVGFNPDAGGLPLAARRKYGFDSGDPLIAKHRTAAEANDSFGWSFKRIAAAIEKYYGLKARRKV